MHCLSKRLAVLGYRSARLSDEIEIKVSFACYNQLRLALALMVRRVLSLGSLEGKSNFA